MNIKNVLLFALTAALSGCGNEQKSVEFDEVSPSLVKMDLSTPPSHSLLMASGQLGGLLYPTSDIKDGDPGLIHELNPFAEDDSEQRMEFGRAIQAWNLHKYKQAYVDFDKFRKKYPESPWAGESTLHMGCEARFNGRYSEADQLFNQVINENKNSDYIGAQILASKAKSRLAVLRVMQNNTPAAEELFTDLKQNSPDWRLRTYASNWLQKLNSQKHDQSSLLDCGTRALSHILASENRHDESEAVLAYQPDGEKGFSIAELIELSEGYGYSPIGLKLSIAELKSIPLPAILQIGRDGKGGSGHYWILDAVDDTAFSILDPQMNRRFTQTASELAAEWQGNAIVFDDTGELPGAALSIKEMEDTYGGCCGVQRAESHLGNPGIDACSLGAPVWGVNMINLNLFVQDTPLYYGNNIGPDVKVQLSYNAQSAIAHNEPFGQKWMFNYATYLVIDPGNTATAFMPDGKREIFSEGRPAHIQPNQWTFNGYQPPASGSSLRLIRNSNGTYELVYPDGSKHVYGVPATPNGTYALQNFLLEVVDAKGEKLTFEYDTDARMKYILDAKGRATTLEYNLQGLVERVTDPFGRVASFEYDAQRNLVKLTDVQGYATSIGYDQDVYITYIEDAKGRTNFDIEPSSAVNNGAVAYPAPGGEMWDNYRITVTDPDNNKEEFYYDGYHGHGWYVSKNNYVEYQSGKNNSSSSVPKTIYKYKRLSSRNSQISEIHHPDGSKEIFNYDSQGNLLNATDRHGLKESFTWNDKKRLKTYTSKLGHTTTYTYASNDVDLTGVSNGAGTTSTTYNDNHQVLTHTDINNEVTTFTYNTFGLIDTITNSTGELTEYRYNAERQLEYIVKDGVEVTRYTYDDIGRRNSVTNLFGHTTAFEFNNLNTVVSVTYPGGRTIQRNFAACPRMLESETLPGNRQYKYAYDSLKRLSSATDPAKGKVSYEYDKNGNLVSLKDKNQNQTRFSYDPSDQLIEKRYADDNKLTYSYDKGRITAATNARGIIKHFTYNLKGQISEVSYSDSTPGVKYEYDSQGRVNKVTDGTGIYQYGYSPLGILTSIDGPLLNDTISFEHDATDRLTAVNVNGLPNSAYTYGRLGRIDTISAFGQQFKYTYTDSATPEVVMSYPNGIQATSQMNTAGQLAALNYQKGTEKLLSLGFRYHATGELAAEESNHQLTPDQFTNAKAQFNNLNQLVQSETANALNAFIYDQDGNLTQGTLAGGEAFVAAYDAESRLISLDFTNANGIKVTERFTYKFDSTLSVYELLHNNVVVEKKQFVRLGLLELQERNGADEIVEEYAWNLMSSGGVGGLLSTKTATLQLYYLYDGRGNIRKTTDATGKVVSAHHYTPYGEPIGVVNPLQPFGFSTKRQDFASGLVYFGYRFYMPHQGRWLNRDPIAEAGGLNIYEFVNSNPVNYIDPNGLYVETAWDVANIAIGLGEFYCDVSNGNFGSAILSGLATGFDIFSAVVPGLPGGASSVLRATRYGDEVVDVAKSVGNFADQSKLIGHFEKHGAEFGVKSADEYLALARNVMQDGTKVQYVYKGETRTGFVQLMGNNRKGQAKFAFVGTNGQGQITTLHTKSGKDFWKTLNGNAKDKVIRPAE